MDNNSLSHTRYNCTYHIVFIPKYRRKVSWYVLNAIGIYTYSPADPQYIVTVPLFNKVRFTLGTTGNTFIIRREGSGRKISQITVGGKPLKGWFVPHAQLAKGAEMLIKTE